MHVGMNLQRFDACCGNGFQPYGLPDAALRGVPDVAAAKFLFAAQLRARVAGVGRAYDQFVFPKHKLIGDVCGEWQVSAAMMGDARSVQPDNAFVVDAVEVQQATLPFLHQQHAVM